MFKYIQESGNPSGGELPSKIEMQFESGITWPVALKGFVQFLRGCGYVIPDEVYPTILDENGNDLRDSWDDWAEGEERAIK